MIGSDFGFAWCPHGTYARELTHLVHLAGFIVLIAAVAVVSYFDILRIAHGQSIIGG